MPARQPPHVLYGQADAIQQQFLQGIMKVPCYHFTMKPNQNAGPLAVFLTVSVSAV